MKTFTKNALATSCSFVFAIVLLNGCATAVAPQSGNAAIPTTWRNGNINPTRQMVDFPLPEQWWHSFNDARLNTLIETALIKNSDLAVAGYKLRQAQLNAGLAENSLFPIVSASAEGSTSKPLNGSASSSRSFSTGASVSYSVDLWGQLAQNRNLKQWEAQATAQDLLATRLTISGTVAKAYWQIAYLNQKRALANQSLAYARKTLELVQVQYRAGAVSQLDVITAEKNVTSQEATVAGVNQDLEVARNAMAILFDAPPSAHINNEPAALPTTLTTIVPNTLPAEVLAHRPDLQAGELRLREALGNIDVARKNFYPTLDLSGRISAGGTQLSQLVSNPLGSLSASLALPFLNWNQNRLNLKISKVAYEQAVVSYRQALYSALQEVENALSAQQLEALQTAKQHAAWQNTQTAERLHEIRYRAGADSLKDWLDAQESRRQAEQSYLLSLYNQYTNQVDLMLALGGGTGVVAKGQ